MKNRTLTLLAASALLVSGLAQAAPENDALFEQFKQLESRSHHGRIAILQEAEICIQQAQDREAYRVCEKNEKAGREALREELKPQREALREQAKAMGITMRAEHSGEGGMRGSGARGCATKDSPAPLDDRVAQ
jgi:hypothetical protein